MYSLMNSIIDRHTNIEIDAWYNESDDMINNIDNVNEKYLFGMEKHKNKTPALIIIGSESYLYERFSIKKGLHTKSNDTSTNFFLLRLSKLTTVYSDTDAQINISDNN